MRKYVIKEFWAWDFEKMEKWLNEMSAKGLAMVDYSFLRFSFEECEPGEYVYKTQFLDHRPNHPESEQYIRFIEETGAEHVASYARWVIFRKKASEGQFEIFSDMGSIIKHLKSIKNFVFAVSVANACIGCGNIINAAVNAPEIFFFSLINIIIAFIGFYGTYKLNKKIKKLKKEQSIME